MSSSDDTGKLILRLVLGVLLLLHGFEKLKSGNVGVTGLVVQHGLPAFVAYGAYVGEIIAPLLLIIGVFTRAAAAVVVINMIVAVLLTRGTNLLVLNKSGGWTVELEAMYFAAALALIFLGAGRVSLGGNSGRFN